MINFLLTLFLQGDILDLGLPDGVHSNRPRLLVLPSVCKYLKDSVFLKFCGMLGPDFGKKIGGHKWGKPLSGGIFMLLPTNSASSH